VRGLGLAGLLCALHAPAAWPLTPAQVYAKVAKLVAVVEAHDAPASGVTLASEKTPFATRRTVFPAARKFSESTENRFVIYLADPAAAGRVRNALVNLIVLAKAAQASARSSAYLCAPRGTVARIGAPE